MQKLIIIAYVLLFASVSSMYGQITRAAVTGAGNLLVPNSIPVVQSPGIVSSSSAFMFSAGTLSITDATTAQLTLKNSGATQNAFMEIQNATGRQWLFGTGLPSSASTGLAYAEYTDGVFQRIPFYLIKGGVVAIGATADNGSGGLLQVSGVIAGTTSLKLGTNPAASGTVSIPNGGAIAARNFANSGDLGIFDTTSANVLRLAYSNITSIQTGATNLLLGGTDVGLSRISAGLLEINSGTVNSGGGLRIPALKSTTGTRFACFDATGVVTSSPTACSGT